MSIISVDETKCVGCNSCIRVCPAVDANIARVNKDGNLVIQIDDEKCIKCGACIKACVHGAREYTDDTAAFFEALEKNEEIALVVAPAIKLAFEDRWTSLLSWFRKRGVAYIYDVSLGADICTWAHLRYLKQNPSAKLITQPCAAVVNYILKHDHSLVNSLSPIHSPMMCTAIFMRKYMKFDGKIAAISPCIAKKDEFSQTGGVINYNVTMGKLEKYIESHGINYRNLSQKSEFEFDGDKSFLGAIYPMPGGLRENIHRHAPEVYCINSEGGSKVYHELDQYMNINSQDLPTVFDVLNCEFGCNEGPGLGKSFDFFRMSSLLRETRKELLEEQKTNCDKKGADKQFAMFDRELNLDYFKRDYTMENVNSKQITDTDLRHSYDLLHKSTYSEMNFNCHSCGYKDCKQMAEAIAKGINVPENCRRYHVYIIETEKDRLEKISSEIFDMSNELEQIIVSLSDSIDIVNRQIGLISDSGSKSMSSMVTVADYMEELNKMTENIISMMKTIDGNIENYSEMTNSVRAIAGKINLLSLNASIESARAGEAGRAFAVVATNIRSLSESSRRSVENAETNEESIRTSIENVNTTVGNFRKNFEQLISLIDTAKDNVNSVTDKSRTITESMEKVNDISKRLDEIVKKTTVILG